jgi:hypothetical protein
LFLRWLFTPVAPLAACLVVPIALRAVAQQADPPSDYLDAACCQCGSFFKTKEEGVGFARHYDGLCGECAEGMEMRYGSLEDAVLAMTERIRGLGAKGRQLHSGHSQAVQDWDNEWNQFWGSTHDGWTGGGTLVGFLNASVALALNFAGGGAPAKVLSYVNTGMQLGHSPADWTNWTGLGLDLLSEEELLRLIHDFDYRKQFDEIWRTSNSATSRAEAIDTLKRRSAQSLDEIKKGANAARMLGVALDLYNLGQAVDALSNNLTDWRVARREAQRLEEEIKKIEEEIDALTKAKQCVMAEIERRNEDGGGVPGGPREWPEDALMQDPLPAVDDPIPPLALPDPTQPDEFVMSRAEQSLGTLKGKIDETLHHFTGYVAPLIITLRAAGVTQDDAAIVAKACGDIKHFAEKYGELLGLVARESRGILQQTHEDTRHLHEDPANRERFRFIDSSVTITAADWVPPFDTFGWTGVAPTGAGAAGRVDIISADDRRLVPPGTYDILWAQTVHQWLAPTVWKTVEITDGDVIEVTIASGAKIARAEWVTPLDGNWGWWGAAPSSARRTREGAPTADADANAAPDWHARINWFHDDGSAPLVLPPGEYDIYWAQGLHQRETPVRIASNVTISPRELKSIPLHTGVRLHPGAIPPTFDTNWGWWAVVPVGGGEDDWVNYSRGDTAQPLVVAPGTYDILLDPGLSADVVRVAERVVVKEGELKEVGR